MTLAVTSHPLRSTWNAEEVFFSSGIRVIVTALKHGLESLLGNFSKFFSEHKDAFLLF